MFLLSSLKVKCNLKSSKADIRFMLIFWLLFAIASKLISQENYPLEISVLVHKGFETSSLQEGKITIIENDSIAYLYNSELGRYIGNNEYLTSKFLKRDKDTFSEKNVNYAWPQISNHRLS